MAFTFRTGRFPTSLKHSQAVGNLNFGNQKSEKNDRSDGAKSNPHRIKTIILKQYDSVDSFLKTVQQEEPLGKGGNSKVYPIPELPEYVLIAPNKPKSRVFRKIKTISDAGLDLNIGQSVLEISGGYKVAKKQSGISTDLHPFVHLLHDPEQPQAIVPSFTVSAKQTAQHRDEYEKYTRLVADMPQKAFDEMAETLKKINASANFFFDPDPTNVLIDKKHQRFNLVDCESNTQMPTESLFGMLRTLLNGRFVYLDETAVQITGRFGEESVATDPKLIALRGQILKKCVLAAHHTNLPVSPSIRKEESSREDAWQTFPWNFEEYLFRISGFQDCWPKVYQLLQSNPSKSKDSHFEHRLNQVLKQN